MIAAHSSALSSIRDITVHIRSRLRKQYPNYRFSVVVLFNKGILKKSAMSAQQENSIIQARLIALLKAHPEGIECAEAAQACGVSSEKLMRIITLNYHDIPIGYDRSYDSKLYWVGV